MKELKRMSDGYFKHKKKSAKKTLLPAGVECNK